MIRDDLSWMCISFESVAGLRLGHVLTPKSCECSWVSQHGIQHNFFPIQHLVSLGALIKVLSPSPQRFMVLLQPRLGWRITADVLQLAEQCFKVSQKFFGVTLICLATNYRNSAAATWAAEPSLHWGWKTVMGWKGQLGAGSVTAISGWSSPVLSQHPHGSYSWHTTLINM